MRIYCQVAFLILLTTFVAETAFTAQDGSGVTEADSTSSDGLLFHLQMGFWYRISSHQELDETEDPPVLWTWDMSGLKWDKKHSSWGLGARVAAGNLGFRAGGKGLYRIPIGSQTGSYIQMSVGMYAVSGDCDLVDTFPGHFLEAELAANKKWALVLGVESLKYAVYVSAAEPEQVTWREERDTFVYGGIKAGQWGAMALTALVFGLAALATGG